MAASATRAPTAATRATSRADVSRAQDILDFLDGPVGSSFTLAPEEAMAFFAAKGLRTTFDWRDMLGTQHTAAFTVAKMMDTDLLAEVHASLLEAMATGKPFREWADGIVPLLQAKGWWGRKAVVDPLTGTTVVAELGSPGRLQTIFRTNMQTAYAAGAWSQIQEQAEVAPYLLYDAVDDHRTRPEHAAWDGQVHPVDSPFWRDHYPPNGWNCRCSVIQLSAEDLDALGLTVTPPKRDATYTWTNPRTGKTEKVPVGLDPGWNYNPGADYLKHLTQTAIAKARALPPQVAPAAVQGLNATESAALAALEADVAEAQKALAKAMGAAAMKRAATKAAERSAQWQLDNAVASKTPYLSTAIKQLLASQAAKGMSPSELLAAAQAKAAQAKASANLSNWKKAYLSDKTPSPAQQAAFDALPDDAQQALLQQLDAIKADNALQAAAQQQLDAIAAKSAGTLEAKAMAKLAPQYTKPADLLAAVQAEVAAQKAAISKATTLAGLKKSLISGKTPTPAQAKLLAELTDDAKAALLAEVDAAKAAQAAKVVTPPEAAKPAQVLPEPEVPLNPDSLVQIGPQKGSNPGGLYQDPDTGVKWYIKRPSNPEQARNEVLAGALYRLAGIDTPELRLTRHQGQTAIASRIVDGLEVGSPAQLAAAAGTAEGFVVDAWLANWDVVGLGFDNLLLKGGRAWRVDTGGALRFRAQGGLKGQAFGDQVLELDSLRNPATNRQAAAVFGKLTPSQIEDGVRRVLAIPEDRIRALVEELGPLNRADRDKLLATLLARREDLARRFPNARPRAEAPAPVATARVTEFEQAEIEASRANGYTLATDGADIEDHHVVAMTYTTAQGKQATRLALKLRPDAAKRLQEEMADIAGAPVLADLTTVKAKGLELLKGINSQAKSGGVIRPDKELPRLAAFKLALQEARGGLHAKVATMPAAQRQAYTRQLLDLEDLERGLDDYFRRLKPGDKAEAFPTFDFSKVPDAIEGPMPEAKASRTPWKKVRFRYNRATIKAGRVIEDGQQLDAGNYARTTYTAEVNGVRITYVADTPDNAVAIRGYAQIEVDGVGADATARALAALERLGVDAKRATPEHRLELYLDRHLYLRSAKDPDLESKWQAIGAEPDQAARIERKLELLNKAAGFDVRTSPYWDPEGRRQAFGHGRLIQYRADLKPEDVTRFNAEHVIFHNPAGLGWNGGSGVLERFQLLVQSGGQLASQVDRIRRGVPLTGSSVSADFRSGGASYVFTRLSARDGLIRQHGAGFILKPETAMRLDAFSYSGDRFGSVDRMTQRSDRAVDLAGMRRNARNSSNETNFRDSVALFEAVEYVVLNTAAERNAAIAFMRENGYSTWPDGRPLESVIITTASSPYRR